MNMFNKKRASAQVFASLLAVCLATTANAQDPKAKLPTDPDIVKGKLANGLTYYIRPNQKPEKKVELRLMVKAGAILENDDQQGLAHFMEHMNFNGTKNFQKNDLVSYLQSIGVQFGADLNAYTGFDQTVYILPIPTDKAGNLEKGFQIIEDWAHNALLTDKDIDEERGVVLEESRLGKGANDRMLKVYFPKYASGSKYAQRLPIGKDDILKTFKYEKIRSFYKDWYRPDLQAVAITGDIDTATAMKLIRQHFGGLMNPKTERPRAYEAVTPRAKPDAMVVTDKEASNSLIQIMFPHSKQMDERTIGDYAELLKREIALQMINQRLNDLAQSANPPFPFAQVYFDNLIHGYESFSAVTTFSTDGPAKAINAMTAEMLKVKNFGFNESELERAKADMMSSIEKSFNERKTTNSKDYVEEYIRNFLDDEPIPGIENEYSYYKKFIPTITVADLNTLAKKWMASNNTFSLITAPDKAELKLPTAEELLAMTQAGLNQKVEAKAEEKIASTLLAKDPTPGKIVSEQKEEGLGATTYTLSNGVKVTIKPTTFKSDEILLKGLKKGGMGNYGVADKYSAQYANDVVEAMGLGAFTPNDLEKVMAGKTATISTDLDDVTDVVNGKSTVKDFETMLQLLYLNVTGARKDEALFNAFKENSKAQVQFLSANPQVAFVDTLTKTLYNGNPLAKTRFPKLSDFDKINLDRALEIYNAEIGNADGYHFFITGNVTPEQAKPLIEKYMASLPAKNMTVASKDNGVRPITGDHRLDFKKGTEKKSLVIEMYYGEVPYSEDMALKAQAVAEVLNIKVIQELREKMGAIYGGGFNAAMVKEPYSRYNIVLSLPCGPENVDKLITAADAEIVSLQTKGPDQKDVDKIKSQWLEKHRASIEENKYWQDKLAAILFEGNDKAHVLQYDEWINKLTAADIQNAAKQLFGGKNKFLAIQNPE